MTIISKIVFLIVILASNAAGTAHATTHTLENGNLSTVQAFVSSATCVENDTVIIPAGSWNWTGTSGLSVSKAITVQGVGNGSDSESNTIINDQMSSGTYLIKFTTINDKSYRLTNLRINGTNSPTVTARALITLSGNCNSCRVDNLYLDQMKPSLGINVGDGGDVRNYALIYNNTFVKKPGSGSVQAIRAWGGPSGWTSTLRQRALAWGTADMLYIEDNTFIYPTTRDIADGFLDSYDGVQIVVRWNKIYNTMGGGHGFDSGWYHSPILYIMHDNEFINQTGESIYLAMGLRGGTGLFYNNTITETSGGFSSPEIGLMNYRSCTSNSSVVNELRWADGTNWKSCSNSPYGMYQCDSDSDCSGLGYGTCSKYYCSGRTQSCSADGDCPDGETCGHYMDGSGTYGYPAAQQVGRGPKNALYPIYAWGNTGVSIGTRGTCAAETSVIQENRDYYNYTASFDGSVGVGSGVYSAMPGNCTTGVEVGGGVAYFATNVSPQGTLYRCSETDTWTVAYTPYTYPHPLRGESTPTLTIPAGVHIGGGIEIK